jgi:hypothetical protein
MAAGFTAREAVRTGLHHAAFHVFGADDAPELRARLDDGGRHAALRQVVSRREARNPAADDDHPRHRLATSASAAVRAGEPFRDSGRTSRMPRPRVAAEQDIDVVENLNVVADEADGSQRHLSHALFAVAVQALFHGRSEPPASHALALVGEIPVGSCSRSATAAAVAFDSAS